MSLKTTGESKQMTQRRVPAVTRAIAILRELGKAEGPVNLNYVVSKLDLVPSTCLHILRVMVDEEIVFFDPMTKKYSLGVGLLPLARELLRKDPFAQTVQFHIEELSRKWDMTFAAVFLSDQNHFTVTNAANSTLTFSLQVSPGSRFPALISATGRCLAAFGSWTQEDLTTKFHELRWQDPPTLGTWLDEIELTKSRGYAVDSGNYIRGVTIISVPVRTWEPNLTRCLAAVGLKDQMTESRTNSVAQSLLKVAQQIGESLGGKL